MSKYIAIEKINCIPFFFTPKSSSKQGGEGVLSVFNVTIDFMVKATYP